ncbi:alpha/beta hydrolase family esterase [Dankookia sp. GCM10030260]|uniref:extracellular catalytic domain type 1 short-chain-length polyhydroxyalkanoate depolymerase n=1 Tax=Dankookia sp. GCM10030260 TaxID=3273390 RepID=UPI0036081553
MFPRRIAIADLVRRSQAMAQGAGFSVGSLGGVPSGDGALAEVSGFGSNPGELRMLEFVPDALPARAPLVVALHGCTQSASGYDRGCGWSVLAARQGFALLLPEQRAANNANRCFNWFEPGDSQRDRGEVASIRQMVAHMISQHRLDPTRVFVTGLSAGGAMTSTLLATYPEVFAAGAILAGLPHGAAQSTAAAFEAMATGRPRPAAERAAAVRAASSHPGPWPRVAVWHGDADTTVRPPNAAEIVKQWQALHGLDAAPEAGASLGRAHRVEVWHGRDGMPLLEHHAIAGMGHGVPISTGGAPLGEAAPFILDVGVSSTTAIAGFFGLGAATQRAPAPQTGRTRPGTPETVAPPTPVPADAGSPGWLNRIIAIGRDSSAQTAAAAARSQSATPLAGPRGWLGQLLANEPEPSKARPQPDEAPAAPARIGRIAPGPILRRALRAARLLDR